MRYQFYTADVFTNRLFGGNPLAVFPDGRGLTAQQMQKVAAELNLSETAFVLPPTTPQETRRLRIFTPKAELPFAGHPTVGAAYVLAAIGEIPLPGEEVAIVFTEGVGLIEVKIRARDGQPIYTELKAAQLPQFGPPPPPTAEIAALLSLEVGDILTGDDSPQAVSCGLPFLFVPLGSREALGRVSLRREHWQVLLGNYWASAIYAFCYDPEWPESDLRGRMFAPALGIEEDPATGSAAAALAGYLGRRDGGQEGERRWQIEQGFEMGRPSLLQVTAERVGGKIVAVRVGGPSVLVSEGTMEIP